MKNAKQFVRTLAILTVVALSASACSSGSTQAGTQAGILEAMDIEVVQPIPEETPIASNPDVRIGTLDNGLTYYAQSNSAPANALSVRLVINAGSMQQEVADSGAAHFLEHMLFNGTKNYPGNELTKELERLGVQFGADSNAYTSADETVYELDLPNASAENVDVALNVLAEWASAASITEEDTINERGVVREEARLFLDGIAAGYSEAILEAMQAGTEYENRSPIGTSEKIDATTPDQLREFYDRWYRPELMAVIAVGDVPVDELEAKIEQQFADLTPRGDNQEKVTASETAEQKPVVKVINDLSMPSSIATLTYPVTNWGDTTVGDERLSIIQQLYGLAIMNRLQTVADTPESGVKQPFAFSSPVNRTYAVTQIGFEGENLAQAATRVREEITGLVSGGFSEADLEQATAEYQSLVDQDLAESATRENASLSTDYVDHFLTKSEISSAERRHTRVSEILSSLTPQEVTDVFRWDMSNSAYQLIVGGPDADDLPSEEDLTRAFERGLVLDSAAFADDGVTIEELMAPPEPTEPTATKALEGFNGGQQWVFDNGLTVNFVPSKTEAGKVELAGFGPGGFGVLEPSDGALLSDAIAAVASSGAGDVTRSDYRRFVDRTTTDLQPGVSDTAQGFVGRTGSEDLETMMQRLHLAIVSPRVDDAALEEIVDLAKQTSATVDLDAGFALSNSLANIINRDDVRFDYLPAPELDALTAEQALALYSSRFGGVTGWTINLAGDADVTQIADLAARYLGTLPAGSVVEAIDDRPELLSESERRTVSLGLDGDAAGAAGIAYQVDLQADNKTRIGLMMLAAILDSRLLTEAREDLGATYGGFVYSYVEGAPINRAIVSFESTGDPDRVEELLDIMVGAADSLATDGPEPDEFDRAKSVLAADFDADPLNEELVQLMPLTMDKEEPITPDQRGELLAAVEVDDIASLAAELFAQSPRAEVLVR